MISEDNFQDSRRISDIEGITVMFLIDRNVQELTIPVVR